MKPLLWRMLLSALASLPSMGMLSMGMLSMGMPSMGVLSMSVLSMPVLAQDAAPLRFAITEGRVENAFYQQGPVAAHLLLSSGDKARVLVAFPAGNSGVGVWFETSATPVQWTLGDVQAARMDDAEGRTLHGIAAIASVDAKRLVVKDAVLGSVRVLRDYQLGQPYPAETAAVAQATAHTIVWQRSRLDGAPGYALTLALENGTVSGGHGEPLVLTRVSESEPLRLRITALTGETPLTPFAADALLSPQAGDDERSRHALQFLGYREKFLAGSWRFDTYFGRDTLLSTRLLMPALQPDAIESGLGSVLVRLDGHGEVAHEEDIGEFAVLRHRREGGSGDAPIYDYAMIDDDLMLAPVAAAYLFERLDLRRSGDRARAEAFLARPLPSGETVGAALARNFAFVVHSARPFARAPAAAHLIAFKAGRSVGQWRDSQEGNAYGRYAYDVNAVWMPAALAAIAQFEASGLLVPYIDATAADIADASDLARIWRERAPPLFQVALDPKAAGAAVADYAQRQGIDPAPALASIGKGKLRFDALALDARGKPIPVLHSDIGFALLFGTPTAPDLDTKVEAVLRPFPAGLLTEVGMVVANPAYADIATEALLGRSAYHGTVVWSWQQALLAAGLARQLQRDDLPEATRARLRDAQRRLWTAIDATRALRTSELWSWSYADGHYRMAPFGQSSGDADESNAAQLWSTVYLAIPRPN